MDRSKLLGSKFLIKNKSIDPNNTKRDIKFASKQTVKESIIN